MCPSKASTPSSALGRRRSIADLNVRDTILELRALFDRIVSNRFCLRDVNGSSAVSYLIPLNRSQSLLLADLVTITGQRLTWLSIAEEPGTWVLCGRAGEASGPRLTVFISATSDD